MKILIPQILVLLLLLLCCITTCFSSPVSISDGIFTSQLSISRNLLQAKKPCPVNFEVMNYTIITSRCKGPQYPRKACCDAFKEFACPYSDEISDLSTDCASRMFGYINSYGNYTDGLFGNLCQDDKIGLVCPIAAAPGTAENNTAADSNSSPNIHSLSLWTLTVEFLFMFIWI